MKPGPPTLADVAFPAAMVLWWLGVVGARHRTMDDWGLLTVLPPPFYAAVVVLVLSSVVLLRAPVLSPARLSLHLVGLVVVLHGTVPAVTGEPMYPWVYKHIGVTEAIDLAGGVDPSVDIYQNWPGFFGAAAWVSRLAGVDPLDLAPWAPIFFNLATCTVLALAYRTLPTSPRTRWMGVFIFVAANWVGQDYFAPQALGFLLSMGVLAMTLAWVRSDRWLGLAGWIQSRFAWLARVKPGPVPGPGEQEGLTLGPRRGEAVVVILLSFVALVATHQLSPFMVLTALVPLAVVGVVQPRWVVGLMVAVVLVYLVPRLGFLDRSHELLSPLRNPFAKFFEGGGGGRAAEVMAGRRISGLAAPALMFCIGLLAVVGLVRRIRAGRSVVLISFLVFSPGVIAIVQGYGGEAIFRIYLFALPWLAILGGSALAPAPVVPLSRLKGVWPFLSTTAVLGGATGLLLLAVIGSAEIYVSRLGEVEASEYFYDRAGPGSRLSLMSPTFPVGIGPRYEEFALLGRSHPSLLTDSPRFRHRILGPRDLPAIAEFVKGWEDETGGKYLVLSYTQEVFAEVLGLSPRGTFPSLDSTLARHPEWTEWYRNDDAVIFRYDGAGGVASWRPPAAAAAQRPTAHPLVGLAAGAGMAAAGGMAWRRRRQDAVPPSPPRS